MNHFCEHRFRNCVDSVYKKYDTEGRLHARTHHDDAMMNSNSY